MRSFLSFLASIGITLLIAAFAAYPLYLIIHPLVGSWTFDKIATRLWQLLMLLAVWALIRQLKLARKRDFGYDVASTRWRRLCVQGFAAGALSMLPITISMLALGVRTLRPEVDFWHVASALCSGVLSGFAVGFLEETFFRGVVLGAVLREMRRPILAITLVSILYASVHFLASTHIPPNSVTWHSGLDLLSGALRNFISPTSIIDAWLALLAVGVLLGMSAFFTGNIAIGVGLHAGWVTVMRATIGITDLNAHSPSAWLVNQSNGYVGWMVFGWTAVLITTLILVRRRLRNLRRDY